MEDILHRLDTVISAGPAKTTPHPLLNIEYRHGEAVQDLCHWNTSTKHGPENNIKKGAPGVAKMVVLKAVRNFLHPQSPAQALRWIIRCGITDANAELQERMLGPHETLGC